MVDRSDWIGFKLGFKIVSRSNQNLGVFENTFKTILALKTLCNRHECNKQIYNLRLFNLCLETILF
jgi:hypothetical protein